MHVPDAMVNTFLGSLGHLGDRLLAAMKAAVSAGGEAGLRIDWHEAGEPVDDTR